MNIVSKLYKIIIFYDKLFFYIIISLLFIGSIFEAIGVSLIIPLISIIILDESSLNQIFNFDFFNFNKASKNELLILFSLIFLIFFVFKTLYLLCSSFLQEKFTYGIVNKLSLMLYNNYLNQPMNYHIEQNSSSIIKNIMVELKNLQTLMIAPFIVLISETLLLISLSIVLIYVDHKAFILISLTLLSFFLFYYILIKNKIKHWGAKRIIADDLKIQNVQETFTSIKEIKIYRAENFFLEKFKEFNYQSSIYGRLQSWFENIPKLMIDLSAIVALLFFIFFTLRFDNSLDLFITKVGLFGFAFFRMLPAINRILISSQNFRFAIPFFNNIYNEFIRSHENNIKSKVKYLNDKLDSIKFSNVEFSYNNNKKNIRKYKFINHKGHANWHNWKIWIR
jgi:ABC-type multidrug transport system fused ATPase/permease subunit